jgi:hypothetical protein
MPPKIFLKRFKDKVCERGTFSNDSNFESLRQSQRNRSRVFTIGERKDTFVKTRKPPSEGIVIDTDMSTPSGALPLRHHQ